MAIVAVKESWLNTGINNLTIALAILYLFLSQGNRIIKKPGSSRSLIVNKPVAFCSLPHWNPNYSYRDFEYIPLNNTVKFKA